MSSEIPFTKYHTKGSMHWDEMMSRSYHKFNAGQQARFETILEWLKPIQEKHVLDLGCGDAALTYLLTKQGANVTGVDNEPEGIKLAQQNFSRYRAKARFVLGDVRSTGLSDNTFDIVVSSEVIEHVERPEELVKEAARLLKPGGVFLLTTPYRLKEQPHPFHVHEFYPGELKTLLKPYFSNIEIKETHNMLWMALSDHPWKHFGRRQIWRYLINLAVIYFHWNPFKQDARNRHKREIFAQLYVKGIKKVL